MSASLGVMQIAPVALCALIFVRSLDTTSAHAQLAPGDAAATAPQNRSGPPPDGDDRGPPPFAYEACVDKSRGDDCAVSFGDRTMEGSCVTGLTDELFCLPDEMPPPPPGEGHGLPPGGPRLTPTNM